MPFMMNDLRRWDPLPRAALLLHMFLERQPVDVLHHHEPKRSLLAEIEHLQNVVVAEFSDGLGLALESLGELWFRLQGRAQHFDRDVAVERRLVALIHNGHAAAPEHSQHTIVAEGDAGEVLGVERV